MTQLDDLVRKFIGGGMDMTMSPNDMDKILVNYYGYRMAEDHGTHRKYKRKGCRNINIITGKITGSRRVQPYSVKGARRVLDAEGLL